MGLFKTRVRGFIHRLHEYFTQETEGAGREWLEGQRVAGGVPTDKAREIQPEGTGSGLGGGCADDQEGVGVTHKSRASGYRS